MRRRNLGQKEKSKKARRSNWRRKQGQKKISGSSPRPPKFYSNYLVYKNALKIHRLLITGDEEEVLRRRGGLTRRLLTTTCEELHNTSKLTVLHLAAELKRSSEVVKVLIEAGADINALDSRQRSPLRYAYMW